jgi:hypothetical protein
MIFSNKTNVNWSIELIEHFKDEWDWKELSTNPSLCWSIELISQFDCKWDWSGLSCNESLPWSKELIKKYEHKWDWEKLSLNSKLPWSIELIEEYKYKWNIKELSSHIEIPWSLELIEKFYYKWDWKRLSSNPSLPWSIELIKKYTRADNEFDWEDDGCNWDWRKLSSSSNLPWSIELIMKFKNYWNWCDLWENENFSQFKLLKNENVIFKLIPKRNSMFSCSGIWSEISASNEINFEFIDEFQNELNWEILSKNDSLIWTLKEISRFASHLKEFSNLWLFLESHLDELSVYDLLINSPVFQIDCSYNNDFNDFANHNIFSKITFGKYKGKSLYEIMQTNYGYVNWCIVNLNHFCLNKYTLNAIEIFFPNFELSDIAKKILDEKYVKWQREELRSQHDYDYEKPQSYENWLSDEFGDEANAAYLNLD